VRGRADPAGRPALSPRPTGGGAEPRGARLGLAGRTAASCMAGPLSDPKEERWRGVRVGVAGNFDRPKESAQLPPSPPGGGEGYIAADGSGACTLGERERSSHDGG
jgi:hypothetical protein